MQMEAIHNLAMVPVRGTVYVVKLPFVYVWRLLLFLYAGLYAVVAAIVSVPVYYTKKLCGRVVFVWNWTKLSVKRSLGYSSNIPAITDGTQNLHPANYLSATVSHHPRGLSLETDDPFLQSPYEVYRRHGRGKRQRTNRKALISHLIRLLLEPNSPAESEDESERPMQLSPEQDEAEKALGLILDLVKLSKAGVHDVVVRDHHDASLQPADLEALLRQAKDREKLQELITELDHLAIEVDPTIILNKRSGNSSGHPSPVHSRVDVDRPTSSASSIEPIYTPNAGSAVSSSDEYADPIDDDYQTHDVNELSERPPYTHGALSPVQESPEYLSASSESLSMTQLTHDLNKALSNLTTEANGLNPDQEVLESMETEIIQKTVTVTESVVSEDTQEDDFSSVPKTDPTLGVQVGHDRRDLANARKSRPPTRKMSQSKEQEPTTDHVSDSQTGAEAPEQGQEEDYSDSSASENEEINEQLEGDAPGNHTKKIPGGVRVLPPLLLTDQIQLLTAGSLNWRTNEEEDETEELSLTATQNEASDEKSDVNTESLGEPRKRNCSDPGPVVNSTRSRRGSTSSDVGGESAEKRTLRITSSQPPWIEMVERRNRTTSSNSSSSATTPTSTTFPVIVYKPPSKTKPEDAQKNDSTHSESVVPQPQGSTENKNDEPNIWEINTEVESSEGIYDTLTPRSDAYDKIPAHHVYLHEKIAARRLSGSSSVEPSPRLPPRNLALKRTASAETVSQLEKSFEQANLKRRDSEKHSSSTRESRSRDKEPRESRSRDKEPRESRSRDKEPRESRSRDKEPRESRSRDKESRESRSRDKESRESRSKDKVSHESRSKDSHESRSREKERREHHRHRSHSSERRSTSRSEHRHLSDRHHHRSRSGDRSSSRSTERHPSSSSHHRSSSEKHRSHSTDKHPSRSSSSSSKSTKESDSKWKVLASPSTSKSRSRLATALFSRSSTKESPPKSGKDKEEKQRKTSSSSLKDKEREKSSKSKSESSKSKSSSKSSKSSDKTPEKSSRRLASASSSPDKDDSPEVGGAVARSSSMSSLKSAGAGSVYSFDSVISGKQTVV